jgi:hypothetical protein
MRISQDFLLVSKIPVTEVGKRDFQIEIETGLMET